MVVDPTPGQTPPQMKVAAGLSDDYEYAGIWTGQSNSRPRGFYADAVSIDNELSLEDTGKNVIGVLVPPSTTRGIGTRETVALTTTLTLGWYRGAYLRLGVMVHQIAGAPEKGYAKILNNAPNTLTIEWLSLPDPFKSQSPVTFDDSTNRVSWTDHGLRDKDLVVFTTTGTLPAITGGGTLTPGKIYYIRSVATDTFQLSATSTGAIIDLSDTGSGTHSATTGVNRNGYIIHEPQDWSQPFGLNGRRYYGWEHARVLTPYVPIDDIQPPGIGETIWLWKLNVPYPNAGGPLRTGKRLALPSPWSVSSAVTSFEDLALFLPISAREGSHGYGISEIADGSYPGVGTPTGHPITGISEQTFTFANAVADEVDLAGGYLIVDWESAGEVKRSWARIASSPSATTFTTDSTSWLGDGVPSPPASKDMAGGEPLVFNTAPTPDNVTWATHGLNTGDRVAFHGGTLPTNVVEGQPYHVTVLDDNTFEIRESAQHGPVDLSGTPSGVTATRVWWYTAWIAHWYDNPYMWLPGPEFAYPNEDHQPHGPFVYWRARGQLIYSSQLDERTDYPYFRPFDGEKFARVGAMLAFSWRTGAALGKRMNMVCLGCNGAPLTPSHVHNQFSYNGVNGWWDWSKYGFGLPLEDQDSYLSYRLKRLITFLAPNALITEGNTKALRYLSACHVQGETDSLQDAGRELYGATITNYKRWLRSLTTDMGASPFAGGAQMPFAQPQLTHDPWETGNVGDNPDFLTFGWDFYGFTNQAMREVHTADEFAGYTITEDLPKLKYYVIEPPDDIDNAHFSGQGMMWQGARLAALILDRLEYALAYSAAATTSTNPRLLRIANLALVYTGQGARQITSLSENTAEAQLVTLMLPEATRQLLSMRPWSWAIRHEPAASVYHSHPDWIHAYVVPGRAVTVLDIIPPTEEDTEAVEWLDYRKSEIANTSGVARVPEPFAIGRSPMGNALIYCNVAELPGDLSEREVADGVLHPERLERRPLIRYVEKVLDPDKYSESFATALSWLLASMLAPALVKGQEGEAVAVRCLQRCAGFVRAEAIHETVTRRPATDYREEHKPPWITAR